MIQGNTKVLHFDVFCDILVLTTNKENKMNWQKKPYFNLEMALNNIQKIIENDDLPMPLEQKELSEAMAAIKLLKQLTQDSQEKITNMND
jgi:hypothetical protein